MTEWIRDGLEGCSLKAILRLYIFGLIALTPVVALVGLLFGAQMAFQVTPLLVVILGLIEYSICYLYPLLRDNRNDNDLIDEDIRLGLAASRPIVLDVAKAGEIKDAAAVESLIADLKDRDSDVRWSAARVLDLLGDVKAQEALNAFLKDINPKKVADDYEFFITIGEEGTEGLLIFVLQKYGSKTMAEDFFNCGNAKLREAAMRWAERHDYSIPAGKEETLRWGSLRK